MDKYTNQTLEVTSAGDNDVIPIQPVGFVGLKHIKKANLISNVGSVTQLGTFNPSSVPITQSGSFSSYDPAGNLAIVFDDNSGANTPQEGWYVSVQLTLESGETITIPGGYIIHSDSFTNGQAPGAGVYKLYIWYEDGVYNYNLSPITIGVEQLLITSISVEDSNPDELVVVFNEIVTATNVGWSFRINTVAETLTGITGSGTNTLRFAFATAIQFGDTLDYSYSQTTGDTIGQSSSTELANATNQAVTNNVSAVAPSVSSAQVLQPNYSSWVFEFDQAMLLTDQTGWTLRINSVAATITGVTGSGTNTLTFTTTEVVDPGDTIDYSYDQSGDTRSQSTSLELPVATNQTVQNNTSYPAWVNARKVVLTGGAYAYVDDVVLSPSNISGDKSFTIEGHVEFTSSGTNDYLIRGTTTAGTVGYVQVTKFTDNTVLLRLVDAVGGSNYIGIKTISAITIGVKYHLVVTYNGSGSSSGMRIYLNGVAQSVYGDNAGTYNGLPDLSGNYRLELGNNFVAGSADCKIDYLRVFPAYAVNSSHVANMYSGSPKGLYDAPSNPEYNTQCALELRFEDNLNATAGLGTNAVGSGTITYEAV